MRVGRLRGGGAAVALLLALAGCGSGLPAGVDGTLVDDWPALPTLTTFTPKAGTCHASFADSGPRDSYAPVPCTRPHRTETVQVGTFTGDAAGTAAPPTRSSPAHAAAYAVCDQAARAYLGRDFRYGRLWLGVTVPSSPAWAGGARWYRCELGQVANVEDFGELVDRSESLEGALESPSPLDLTCYQVTATAAGAISRMAPMGCTAKHNSEFVGVFAAPASLAYPKSGDDWEKLHTRCRAVVAAYAKVPNDANLRYRTGTVAVPNTEDDWTSGNRGVRCYLYVNAGSFTRSLRGVGVKGLPER
ncbi:hypothetical protein GCM10010124_00860 [Pilimelia terevasa]|uniref:Septum formation-related domain-containing protein n=1 Tax=Pilimelia terevasa TaxID=53372 RepID=A0A8J3BHT0_9ACTN|nr:septum formation family protein [Pilimelia terevasa]GGK12132.1 hypothetical protein GCM10010124_00860 [Pilimelia terevasa]